MTSARDHRLEHLQRALTLYAEHAEASPDEIRALLVEHPDLREILEPMFADPEVGGATSDDAEGRIIGDFRLIRELGRGGMGVVYEATEMSLGRRVALKVLPTDRIGHPEAIVRFRREAAAAAALDHPGIVKVYACSNDGDIHYIAMDFVDGVPLSEILTELKDQPTDPLDSGSLGTAIASVTQRRSLTPLDDSEDETQPLPGSYIPTVVGFVIQVADALAHAHEHGVIHRDVKPANILVRPNGDVVLTDFGIARRDSQPSLTQTGDIPGTPFYIAPEQVAGGRLAVDRRADVFSLGVTLYEVLTTQRPFVGRTSQQVMNRIVGNEPVHPQRLNAHLPSDLAAIVLMALEKDPGRRYQSASAFAADLRAFLSYKPILARPPGALRRLQRWARREPLRAGLAAVLALALLAVAGGVGYWSAIQPVLEAGNDALRREQIERALAQGFLQLKQLAGIRAETPEEAEATREVSRSAFRRALEQDPECIEAVAGLALLGHQTSPANALTVLGEFDSLIAKSTPLRRLRAYLIGWAGDPVEAKARLSDLGPVEGPIDAFVAGIAEIQLGHRRMPGAIDRAVDYLNLCVLTADRPRPLYHFERAHALGHAPDPPGARAAADAIDHLWPDMVEARFWAAFALCTTDPKRAAASIRRALESDPDRWLYWNNLGVYLRGAGDLTGSRDAFLEALRRRPLNPTALHDLAAVYTALGEFDSAEASYRRTLEQSPRYLQAWVSLAELQLGARRFEDADKTLTEARRVYPRSAAIQLVLGQLRLETDRIPEAVEALQRSFAGDPDSRTAFHLGRALTRVPDRNGAIAAYRRAVQIDPKNAEAHNNLGNLLRRDKSKVADAEHHLRLAISLDPKLPEPNRALWSVLNSQSRKAEVLAHCDDWRNRLPDDPNAWGKSAYSLLWLGPENRRENAIAATPLANRALELSEGKIPTILHDVAWVRFHAGDTEFALKALNTGLEIAIRQKLSVAGVQNVIRKSIRQIETASQRRP